jgi:hypothetical protein
LSRAEHAHAGGSAAHADSHHKVMLTGYPDGASGRSLLAGHYDQVIGQCDTR